MVTSDKKDACLERRVDFMLGFIIAMRGHVSEELLNGFISKDRQFIYNFCEKIDHPPGLYINMYDAGIADN